MSNTILARDTLNEENETMFVVIYQPTDQPVDIVTVENGISLKGE